MEEIADLVQTAGAAGFSIDCVQHTGQIAVSKQQLSLSLLPDRLEVQPRQNLICHIAS